MSDGVPPAAESDDDNARLGPKLGSVYHELSNEVGWLQVKWQQYVELFGKGPKRVELLNHAAGFFFEVVHESLFNDILLHMSRLVDSSQTNTKSNLTIKSLPELIDDKVLSREVAELVDKAFDAASFARDWRNRHLAHRDLKLALQQGTKSLESASREKMQQAITSIQEVLNHVSLRLLDSTTAWEHTSTPFSDARALLRALYDGVEAHNAKMARLKAGAPLPEDFEPPDY